MLKLWLEHWSNPLHFFCRFICVLDLYNAVWQKVFKKTPTKINWMAVLTVWRRIKMNERISQRLLDRIFKGTKGD